MGGRVMGGGVMWLRRSRQVLVVLGTGVMGYAVIGALGDPQVRPLGHLLFLAGVLVAHDAVLLPAAIGVGALIGRYLPVAVRVPVQVAGLVTVTLLVVATPLVLGLGRRPDTPSALPLDYGRGLAAVLLLIWGVALGAAFVRHRAARRAASPAPADSSGAPSSR